MMFSNRSASRPREQKPRRAFRWWLALSGLILGVIATAWLMNTGRAESPGGHSDEQGKPVQGEPGPVEQRVDVVRPRSGGIPRKSVQPGSIHSFESVDLYAMVSGYLKKQTIDIGSRVKKGQVLAEIGVPREESVASEATALVEQARSRLRQAEVGIKAVEAEKQITEASVRQTRADVARCTARCRFTQSQYERVSSLHQKKAVPLLVVDEARHEAESARAAEEVATLAIATAESRLASAVVKIDQARADAQEAAAALRVAESRLARAQVDLDYATIRSPFDGVVTSRKFHPGEFIRSASEGGEIPLLTVDRTDLMRVVVLVPDRDVVLANAGDSAEVAVDALGGERFHGVVARVAESQDPTTRAMRAEIDLPNPGGLLRAGMYGQATILLDARTSGLTLPVACIAGREGTKTGIVRVVRDGAVHVRKVTLGSEDGTLVEITSDLSASDLVVARADGPLDEGTPVVYDDPPPTSKAPIAASRPTP